MWHELWTRVTATYEPILRDREWRRRAWRIAVLNLTLIAISLAVPWLRRTGVVGDGMARWLSASRDSSAVEVAGYLQMVAACWFMVRVFRITRSRFDLLLAGIIGFLLTDDLSRLHDQLREVIGDIIGLETRWFRAEDLGEAIYAFVTAAVMTSLLVVVGRRARTDDVLRSLPVVASFVLLGGFAIGADNVQQLAVVATSRESGISWFLENIEDGGELVAMGVMLMAASARHRLAVRNGAEAHGTEERPAT